ncbi:hypothetical protein CHARACLAT_004383 [Characodon lateralis]|uniref:Rootletin-like coiled-coil domain-containing protein n=1 Tax=Characodon lateralis TaxID=208331 RepID=A0ABU7CXP6_9TELE|nr:hypothetical protein [Characodon lateralis]
MAQDMLAHLDSAERQKRVEQDLNIVIQKQSAQLQEERSRSASLSQVNSWLREQLDQVDTVNNGLVESLLKARKEAQRFETRLRGERETYASRSSHEQARVRALWRQATSLRSTFTQLKTFTDRALSDMRGECVAVCQLLHVACKKLEARAPEKSPGCESEMLAHENQLKNKLKETMQLQVRWDAEKVELNCRILELTDTLNHFQNQNSEKDASLHTMRVSLEKMETMRAEDRAEMAILHTEVQALQTILYQIHQLVSSEGENSESENMSASPLLGTFPPKNSTLIAVQNVLSKHLQESQEMDARLKAALVQVDTFKDQLQQKYAERTKLEKTIQDIQREHQEAKKALEESLKENKRSRCTLELIINEKGSLEKLLSGLQQEVDSQRGEQNVLRSSSLDLQRQRDLLRQQREDLEMQLSRQHTEACRGEKAFQELERRYSDLRSELITVKESLDQITLEKEMLEDENTSLSLALNKMECHSAAQESLLIKLQSQLTTLKDSLIKMAALSEGLATDKVELNRIVLQTEGEKMELSERRCEAEGKKAAAREDAARAQKEMINLLAERQAFESSHVQLQDLCQKLEAELSLLHREKAEALEKQLEAKRQMQTLQVQLCACSKELDERTTAVKRAARDREELAKDKAALEVKLNCADRTACCLTQQLVALRAEKNSLETAIFESQELSTSLEAELTRLEGERCSLNLANEALTRDAAKMRVDAEQQLQQAAKQVRMFEEKLAEVERNALLMLNNTEQIHRGQLEAEHKQTEQQFAELMVQQQLIEEQLRTQCEELRVHNQRALQQVQDELAKLQKEFNQSLLQAESEKQQTLFQQEAEKAALTDKIASLQQDLALASMGMERIQREVLSKQEQEKNSEIVKCKLKDLQYQFQESLTFHQSTRKSLNEHISELNQQKEQAKQELEGLRHQLQETEDSLLKGQRDLTEAHRELQGCVQEQDKLRKETLELSRVLADETREKEAIQVSNQELRAFIKRAERDNNSLRRALQEKDHNESILEEGRSSTHEEATTLRSTMRELEKSHLQARRELQELRRKIKVLESNNKRQDQELLELQDQVCQKELRKEEAQREVFALNHRILECEAAKEAALIEVSGLQRCVRELETANQQSQELLHEKEAYQQQSDQRHRETTAQLEEVLEDSKTQINELSVKLSLTENRTQSLEEQLNLSKAKCCDLEHQLTGLFAALHYTVDINQKRLCHKRGSKHRSPTPSRRNFHTKEEEYGSEESGLSLLNSEEINVTSVQTTLQEFMKGLRDAQRERDEAQAHIVSLSQHVTELKASQEKSLNQMLELQSSLRLSEEGKQEMVQQLHKLHASLTLQHDVAHCKQKESRNLEVQLAQLKTTLQASQTKSRSLQDKLEFLQGLETGANAEKQKLKKSLDAAESRVSRLELSQCTLQGELQRAHLRTAELDAETGALQERLTDTRKKLGESEDRCAALKVSEERLAVSLARAEQHENMLREQVHMLSNTISLNRKNTEDLQEQVTELQRALAASEGDRRLLQKRLDKTQDALSESKRVNYALTEQTQNLKSVQEESYVRISELEKCNKMLKESLKQQEEAQLQTSMQSKREKKELQEKLTNLQSSLQMLQNEKAKMEKVLAHLSKDKSALRKTLEKVEMEKLRKEEDAVSVAREIAQLEQALQSLEKELSEEQRVVQTLKVQISELEHAHEQHLLEVTAHHHKQLNSETERLRNSQLEVELALETREMAHHQRVILLEEQVLTLKEQLDHETRRRQEYFIQML